MIPRYIIKNALQANEGIRKELLTSLQGDSNAGVCAYYVKEKVDSLTFDLQTMGTNGPHVEKEPDKLKLAAFLQEQIQLREAEIDGLLQVLERLAG